MRSTRPHVALFTFVPSRSDSASRVAEAPPVRVCDVRRIGPIFRFGDVLGKRKANDVRERAPDLRARIVLGIEAGEARDVLRRVVGELRDPAQTRVAEVMTTEVVCCRSETALEEARGSMMNRRIRHLPVVDDQENMVGLISIGDLNAHERTSHEQTIYLLEEYVYGRV